MIGEWFVVFMGGVVVGMAIPLYVLGQKIRALEEEIEQRSRMRRIV